MTDLTGDRGSNPLAETTPTDENKAERTEGSTRPDDFGYTPETFDDVPIHAELRKLVDKLGWKEPTPVQKLCFPHTLKDRDVAGFAQTGTGKTAVFLLTIANRFLRESTDPEQEVTKGPRAVIIAPTRELAIQIEQDAQEILHGVGLTSMAVFGGIDYQKQAQQLKSGVDVVVATPGRLRDYAKQKIVDLSRLEVFVCDEADRMFDMGFIEDIEFFLKRIPEEAQKLLFSATTNDQVKELAFEYLENPEYISVNPEVITPEKIEQHAVHCHATNKFRVLLGMLRDHQPECAIIFTNTKLTAEWVHYKLVNNEVDADLITGDLPQKKRIRLIEKIKEGKVKALIATDVASRGLHISRISHVYNFDLPDEPANYIHRIGRTARAGAKGSAYSLVCDDYGHNLDPINRILGDMTLRTEWFDEKYLEIEDKAGNPFADRGKSPAQRAEKPRTKTTETRGESHGGKKKKSAKKSRRRDEGDERRSDSERKGAAGPGGGKKKRRGGRKRSGKKAPEKHRQPSQAPAAAASAKGQPKGPRPEEAPKTFGGLVKRIAKTIFGKS